MRHKTMGNRKQVGLGLRLVVAAYLVYLGVQMFDTEMENASPYLGIFFGIAFIAVGAIYGIYSFISYRKAEAAEIDGEAENTSSTQEAQTTESAAQEACEMREKGVEIGMSEAGEPKETKNEE